MAPQLAGVLETALYVEDLPRALQFYRDVLELEVLGADDRFGALSVAGRQVLLLFKKGASRSALPRPGGIIPPHDGSGQLHLAFAIPAVALPEWEERLRVRSVPLESKVAWELGGTSLYFRDPDRHLIELATPGVWAIY
jgi:catechol 2,3-dioxygenase-like lactoylglutathione lyase family enzyme